MKIGKVEIDICPYCKGDDFRYGYQSGDSRLYGAPGFWKSGTDTSSGLCTMWSNSVHMDKQSEKIF